MQGTPSSNFLFIFVSKVLKKVHILILNTNTQKLGRIDRRQFLLYRFFWLRILKFMMHWLEKGQLYPILSFWLKITLYVHLNRSFQLIVIAISKTSGAKCTTTLWQISRWIFNRSCHFLVFLLASKSDLFHFWICFPATVIKSNPSADIMLSIFLRKIKSNYHRTLLSVDIETHQKFQQKKISKILAKLAQHFYTTFVILCCLICCLIWNYLTAS
jgi:hypothetical protein